VRRTRRLLQQALIDLIAHKGYDAVTVQDIIDRADVGRSTFYLHFVDKEQLLLSGVDELREFLAEQQRRVLSSSPSWTEHRLGFSLAMLEHAQSHHRLYKAMVGKRGGAVVHRLMREMIADLVRSEITAALPRRRTTGTRLEAVVEYAVAAFMALLGWWMDNDMPCSAAEMDQLIRTLSAPGIAAGIEQATVR
jgi:AcrR family transcriptional regulator